MASAESNAIGSVELECTPAGLSIGLHGVGSYQEGYAPGPLTHGTRFCIPFEHVTSAHHAGNQLRLNIHSPGFPHERLTLTRFTAGPGVPLTELRKRRQILHFAALSLAVSATIAGSMLAPAQPSATIAWGALGYGALAAIIVLGLGYSLDQRLFLRPADEESTRKAFVTELAGSVASLRTSPRAPERRRPLQIPRLSGWLPRTAAAVGITLAATVLTALVSGQRLLQRQESHRVASAEPSAPPSAPIAEEPPPAPSTSESARTSSNMPPSPRETPELDESVTASDDSSLAVDRPCICDRADSPLWRNPIPRLSVLLLEKRVIPRKNHLRLRLEVAVVNNGDAPIEEITLHAQFYEDEAKTEHTKERPLYYEGPLDPGEAIKWSTEARGTHFEIQAPHFGSLGADGQGSASADAFAELLEANHRPVRLHAARMLSYLGDPRGREGALRLKDALRAAEGPYLRRVLAATAPLRVCDVELAKEETLSACVYNAGDVPRDDLGLQVSQLSSSLDVSHPLANPPELLKQKKWRVPAALPPEEGRSVRVTLPSSFVANPAHTIEASTARFDLLD